MTLRPISRHQLYREITQAWAKVTTAIRSGDLDAATVAYREVDRLLDELIARTPTSTLSEV